MATRTELHELVEARLRAAGQRYTAGRRAIVERLGSAGQPLTIPEMLEGSSLPQSSAYRNLAVLEQAGTVHRIVTTGDFARYELTEDLTEHHHHLICSSCGQVEDFTAPPALERSLHRTLADVADASGFSTVHHRLDLVGTCRSCS
jgi:Fur family ferric uptake transcriptional regulator